MRLRHTPISHAPRKALRVNASEEVNSNEDDKEAGDMITARCRTLTGPSYISATARRYIYV